MPSFIFKGIDKNGASVTKTLEAQTRDLLAENLVRTGYTILSIAEKKQELSLAAIDTFLEGFTKVKTNDLVMFTIQLGNMLDAGVALPTSLSTLETQTENPKLKKAIAAMTGEIRQGKTFSEAMAKHRDIFSNLYINMIAAGEVSGNLDEVLARLAQFTEHEADLKQKLSAAMMYPMILMVAGIAVLAFVVTSMLPPFVKIFQESNVPLPLPTLMLYNLNLFIRAAWLYLIAGSVAAWFGIKRWGKTPAGKLYIDNLKLKIPVWGDLILKVEIARLSKTLGALLSSGVPILQALQVTEKTIDVAPIAQVIRDVGAAVGKGKTISGPLEESGYFPPMPVHMIAVGEETGTLEKMLIKVSDFYELATDYAVKKLTAFIEPVALVVIGGLVGLIFASILLPIFNMVKVLKH